MNDILKLFIDKIHNCEISTYIMLRLLETYYDGIIEPITNDDMFPNELSMPLDNRPTGIIDALQEVLSMGVDMNEGDCFNPLMMAVGHADAPMTEFLLKHGADAKQWPDMDEDLEIDPNSNYYYEDLDIAYMDENYQITKSYVDALIKTADVLRELGDLGGYAGHCLLIDTEKKTISFQGIQPMF